MHKARQKGAELEPIRGPVTSVGMLYAKDVDPDNRPNDHECPSCPNVRVYFSKAVANVDGGKYYRPARFNTMPRQKAVHHEKCRYVSEEFGESAGYETIKQAVESGHYVALKINAIGEGTRLQPRPQEKNWHTQYGRWCSKHRGEYVSVPVPSVEKYWEVHDKILKYGGPDAFERVIAVYKDQYIPHSEFLISNDADKIKSVYGELSRGRNVFKHAVNNNNGLIYLTGFPRMIKFSDIGEVTRAQSKSDDPWNRVYGSRVTLEQEGHAKQLLLNALYFRSDDEFGLIHGDKSDENIWVIARPIVYPALVRKNNTLFAEADKSKRVTVHPTLSWQVLSERQVQAANSLAPEESPDETYSHPAHIPGGGLPVDIASLHK